MTEPSIPTIVRILPTQVWVENDIFGARHVVLQHEGHEPFTYATFNYGYMYTDNAGTFAEANRLAVELGATEPVEHRRRALPEEWQAAMKAARDGQPDKGE